MENKEFSSDKFLSSMKALYAGKTADPPDYKKAMEPNLYYKECIQEAQDKFCNNDKYKTEIEKQMKIQTLRQEIVSIGQNMQFLITYTGCRLIMLSCSEILVLGHNLSFGEEAKSAIISTVLQVLNINLNVIKSSATYSNTLLNMENYFNTFDLLINMYYLFGKKDIIQCLADLAFDLKSLSSSDDIQQRLEKYKKYQEQLKKETWGPIQFG